MLLAATLLTFGLPMAAVAQDPAYRVADLAPNTPAPFQGGTVYPSGFEPVANGDVFLAPAGSGEASIWRTDGTPGGTRPVVSGAVLGAGSFVGSNGDRAFYVADMGLGVAAWATDGTAAGTTLLRGGLRHSRLSSGPQEAVVEGRLFFQDCAPAPSYRCEVWSSDGTPAGTVKIVELYDLGRSFTGSGGVFYFFGRAPEDLRTRLWRTDGTAAGTVALRSFDPSPFTGGASVAGRCAFVAEQKLWVANGNDVQVVRTLLTNEFIDFLDTRVVADQLYFLDASSGSTLAVWRTDGTVGGTFQVLSKAVLNSATVPGEWVQALGDRLYYLVPSEQGRAPYSLWSSDAAGHGAQAVSCSSCSSIQDGLWRLGNRLLFTASAGSVHSLWTIDQSQVPQPVAPFCSAGSCETGGHAEVNGRTTFWVTPASGAAELWATDGTAAGTLRIQSLHSFDLNLYYSAHLDAVLFGASTDVQARPSLWLSRGTAQSTIPLTPVEGAGSMPFDLRRAGDRVAFFACAEQRGLWGANAHDAEFVKETYVDCQDSSAGFRPFVTAGAHAFFAYEQFTGVGAEVWATQGTAATTIRLLDDAGAVDEMAAFGNDAVFWSRGPGNTPTSFWRSDGTVAGTAKAFDLPAGVYNPSATTDVGGELYFRIQVYEIWRTHGTAAGLRRLVGLGAGSQEFTYSPDFTRVGSFVYLAGRSGIWRSDGTAAGTSVVVPTLSPTGSVSSLHEQGGALIFTRTEGGISTLWRTQGTPATTQQISTVAPAVGFYPSMASFDGRFYFAADDGAHGVELWRTDGTAAGTVLVRDIGAGAISGNPRYLVATHGRLYFTADESAAGSELWVSDGTSAGTYQVQDIAPDAASSDPRELTVVGDLLYFSADDGATGRELWALPLDAAQPSVCTPSDERLCLEGGRFQVEVSWRDFAARTGVGHAVALTGDTGYFWFFDPANVELTLKVLDGTGLNGHHWVFYGALSSVEYTVTVTDTRNGHVKRYVNPSGTFASVGDTSAFAEGAALAAARAAGASASLPQRAVTAAVPATAPTVGVPLAQCVPSASRLCLQGGRFAVDAAWTDFAGNSGGGTAVPLTGDTGYFWFFGPSNVEVVIKVLDGRPVNGKFWVFYGALSNVEYTLTVTDTATGAQRQYHNPSGRFASVGDTSAF
ncbi:MAG TPA: ELWxxDGT repeat protein [Thermoanaerobaculia bacterium]|nr:ELWxxDGT repeat protein [Thermoanaerobaculia bacterium]